MFLRFALAVGGRILIRHCRVFLFLLQQQQQDQDQDQTLSCPFGATSHFLLLAQEKVTKEKGTPVSRRADEARTVPCAARHDRAGPNSHIHVLKHAGLSPGPGSAARHEPMGIFQAKSSSESNIHGNNSSSISNRRLRLRRPCDERSEVTRSLDQRVKPQQRSKQALGSRLLALRSESPFIFRRVAEESGGERRACSRPWMAEFAPADGF